ncbi:MAG: glycosyl hydrolase, partial [Planctomycetota bacterium]|nr:glycosyl hydrolase [Planctomycetota bacterium]
MARASDPTSAPAFKHKLQVPKARRGPSRVLVGTRKGIFLIDVDDRREEFTLRAPSHLGSTAFHVVADPLDRRHVLAAIRTPEGRPTVLVSDDGGERWVESSRPPAFGQPAEGDPSVWERTVNQVFWLTPGHGTEHRTWYCGTSPKGLFRSTDGGHTWAPVAGLHRSPAFDEWTAPGEDGTPDGPKLHSVLVDPRTPDRLLLAMSEGGVLESLDGGDSWTRLADESVAGS